MASSSSSTGEANPLLSLSAITLFTSSVAASKAFYTSVFSATVLLEDSEACAVQFNNNLIVNLLDVNAADDLVKPRKVATLRAATDDGKDIADGRAFLLSIWVKDIDAVVTRLQSHKVKFLTGPEPELKPWGLKVVTFEDPGGHVWEVGQHVKM